MASCGYVGKGRVYLDGRFVGNVSALDIAIAEEKIEQANYTSPGGGNCATVTRIDTIELNMTMTSYDPDNIAMAVFGTTSAVAGSAVTDESQTAPSDLTENKLIITDGIIDTTIATVVTSDPAGTTHVEGTDYITRTAGIEVIAGGGISADDPLLISYTAVGTDVVQALTEASKEFVVTFDGLNEADSGNPVVLKAYRVKFGPSASLPFVADDFAELSLVGDMLPDETIVTAGSSKYFTVTVVT